MNLGPAERGNIYVIVFTHAIIYANSKHLLTSTKYSVTKSVNREQTWHNSDQTCLEIVCFISL